MSFPNLPTLLQRALLVALLPITTGLCPALAQAPDWKAKVEGTNLVLGREARFTPLPLYRKTKTGTETTKLTDGEWKDEPLPHSKGAVGWAYINGPIHILFDLGAEKNIGTVVARFQGGKKWESIVLPKKVNVLLSQDGIRYYEAGSLTQVTGGESELAREKPDTYFYRPEVGANFIHPFQFEVQRKARYLALQVTPGVNNLFSDEIFVMEATDSSASRSLEGLEPAQFVSQGVQIRPKGQEFAISTNVPTPNYFSISDMRSPEEKSTPVRTIIDLPKGIRIQMGWHGKATSSPTEEGGNRWIIEELWDAAKPDWQNAEGPVYFLVEKGFQPPEEKDARITISTDAPHSAQNSVTLPIRFLTIPPSQPQSALHVSLAWMDEKDHAALYPQFLESFKHLGFTAIGTFPRNRKTEEDKEWLRSFAKSVKAAGLDVIYNESPFHVMEQVDADKDEIFNLIDGKRGKHLCQVYAGPYYQKEMARVRDAAALVEPDYVIFDIELWYRSTQECKKCSRCQEAFKASGTKEWDAFMHTQGTRMIRDLSQAITRGGSGSGPAIKPLTGSYNFVPTPPVYHNLFSFPELHPAFLDFSMPVLYVRGDVEKVHQTMRENFKKSGKRIAIPWLTGGTYGEYAPFKLEQQILEAALNGARGFTYYRFQDNDPLDYYHQAMALAALAPYGKLLENGTLLPFEEEGSKLATTAWGTDREALLLIGNYTRQPLEIAPAVKGKKFIQVKNAKTQENIDLRQPLQLAPDEQILLWCTFQ